ncbi:helix-turn-helix transcriptional regulator [Azospirillum sp. TSO35-2]|uniref:AraC family transcriptional regulator n=1 Tax=Azospirillum sp. TSO35-2 TaxID=716796 RepID=UPI000D61953F|nr:helix-turn-helix transcriptional regulator [Azospirillum sp. TSO35-2]PWC40943.1 AraC family transcriptional regulator [Azospirillum sp. TSO35-2]
MKQPLRYPWPDLDVDDRSAAVIAVRVGADGTRAEVPDHRHRKGQLVVSLGGSVTCRVPTGLWMVPPHCGVWIPSGLAHSNRATATARLFFVYIEPDVVALPDRCCTMSLSPLLREVILDLSDTLQADALRQERLIGFLLGELPRMPVQRVHLPLSTEPRLTRIASALAQNPADRRTLAQWAEHVALSESSLARLVIKETGLTFGRWRQQMHLIVAIRELASGASVQNISADLGYESVTAFITMFKKALGKPPATYLKSVAPTT